MKKKLACVFMFFLLFAGVYNECFAQSLKISNFNRQRFYINDNFSLNGKLNDYDKSTFYEGLHSLVFDSVLSDKIAIKFGLSGYLVYGTTATRPWDLGIASIIIKDFFGLPMTFEAGIYKNLLHEGFMFGQLRTYGVKADWKLGKNLILKTNWNLENETHTTNTRKPGNRHENWLDGVLNWNHKSGLVQLGLYRFNFSPDGSDFYMPYLYADGSMGNLNYLTEWGYQTGSSTSFVDQKALGGYIEGKYTLKNAKTMPYLGVRYYHLSGDDPSTKGKFEGWNKLYRSGTTYMAFGEIATRLKDPNETNMNILDIKAGFKPGKLVNFDLELYTNNRDKVAPGINKNYGTEINAWLGYQYAKNVSFEIKYCYFTPGKYFGTSLDPVTLLRLQTIFTF